MKFYNFDSHKLKVDQSYPFRIFIYDPRGDHRIVGAYEQEVLTQEKVDEWEVYQNAGAKFQIHIIDEDLFYKLIPEGREHIKIYNADYFFCCELKERRDKLPKNSKFHLREEIAFASNSNDFKSLISYVKKEVLCFPLTISEEVSTCTTLVEKLFVKDIRPVRVATLAFLIAENLKITDEIMISQLLISCLVRDLGLALISRDMLLSDEKYNDEYYLKHPMLSIFLLSKSSFDFSDQVKRYILEHHEQSDGSGFPRGKKETHIHRLSMIINLSEQIIDHFQNNYDKENRNLLTAINIYYKRLDIGSANTSFPQDLTDSLVRFVQLES